MLFLAEVNVKNNRSNQRRWIEFNLDKVKEVPAKLFLAFALSRVYLKIPSIGTGSKRCPREMLNQEDFIKHLINLLRSLEGCACMYIQNIPRQV